MLDDRKAAILAALVEDHIATGSPVSSRAILERSRLNCSTATIRNDLAVLERDGLVSKPHTSAGRIPTETGYRYYVDHISPGSLRPKTVDQIEDFFSSIHAEVGKILRETSDLLSDITHYPAVVLGPGLRGHTVRDVHVLPVQPGVVLLVLVTEAGRVHQSVIRMSVPATPVEVASAQEVLTELIVGLAIEDDDPTADVQLDLPDASVRLVDLALDALRDAATSGRDIYVGGTSKMVSLWEDLAKLHRILALLDREASVSRLLEGDVVGTTVRLGTEIPTGEDDLAVISTPYQLGGLAGRMGVLGPLRMDYRRAIRVVEEVSDALGDRTGG